MLPVAIRFNNPGALNTVAWVRAMPGYQSEQVTTPGNSTARFDTPEHGVAAYWELLRRYRISGITTVGGIITQYGGGQDYSAYLGFVVLKSGLLRSTVIYLSDDATLLKLARAMFHYEAGQPSPLTDAQIVAGFNLGRARAGVAVTAPEVPKAPIAPEVPFETHATQLPLLVRLILKLFGR